MTINQVINDLKNLIPLAQAEDYDNVGLLCGNPDREVTGILVCHDALENVVDEAIQKNHNLIVTFHPIIFSGLKKITGNNYVEKAVIKAIENKVAIYAIHTALDNDYWGVNYAICQQLGLKNQKILLPKSQFLQNLQVFVPTENAEELRNALFSAGAGKLGFYDECSFSISGKGSFRPLQGSSPYIGRENLREKIDEILISVIFENYRKNQILHAMRNAHPYEEVAYQIYQLENDNPYLGLGRFGELEEAISEIEFLNFVKEKFNLKVIRHSTFRKAKIKRVAVLGGSGASGITAALANSCDAYLTGDLKYHEFFQVEDQMLLADIGHFESEQFVTDQLVEFFSQKFTTFAISKSTEKTNPVNYFL